MVEVSDIFVGGLVLYKLYGRYVHLWVQPWQTLLAASADEPLKFLLHLLSSMQEHIVEDDGLMRSLSPPSGVFIEEQFGIKPMFCLPNGQPCFPAHSLVDWDLCNLSP